MSTVRGYKYFLVLIPLLFAVAAKTQTRIMPLGNSITEGTGSSHHGGYRRELHSLLQNAGLAFDFVGSQQYGNGFSDIDHEGHPGFVADQLTVPDYLAHHPAETVFLEIGTNDISYGASAAQVRDAIGRIVDNIYLVNPDIAIYLSTVIPRKDSNALQQVTDALNALLPALASAKSARGYRIYLVDIAARFKADPNWKTNLLADNLHPNDAGYAVMANEWYNAYRLHLQPGDIIMADDFNGGALDENKWRRGSNGSNLTSVSNNRLELKANGPECGWVITRQSYPARNTTVTVRVVQPNDDGNLGMSSTFNFASPFGIYDQPNWYRFYTYRNGNSGPYRLFVAWKKNGLDGGLDVTGNLTISGAVYLRLRCDHSVIYFEASFDGAAWMETYRETFALPGHTLESSFHYELSGYYTSFKGNLAVDDFAIAAVQTGADTLPPQISAIAAQEFTANSARIIWQTNEPANSQVEYGLTANYDVLSPLDPGLNASHAVTLSALTANTTYHYRVKSRDAAGNLTVSGDYTFTTAAPADVLWADNFNAGALDNNKWLKGTNPGNKAAVTNGALDLKSQGTENGWVITRQAFPARNTVVAVKMVKPNDDGNLGMGPAFNSSSKYGLYDQNNWYRFYTYRSGHAGPYRLYAEWNKNRAGNGRDVTGNLVINGVVHLRLRFDNSRIHFEASLDGMNWIDTYNEIFDLPGYTLDTPFYYELSAYNTGVNGVLTVDDFSIKPFHSAPDTQLPVISNVAAQNLTTHSAQISWQTDEEADSQVEYGLTTNYGVSTSLDPALVTLHAVSLSNLQANTLYHYRLRSKDAAGNTAVSRDFTFTTLAPATVIFADDFAAINLDGNKWQRGANKGNKSFVQNGAFELKSQNGESGWIATRNAYPAQNTTVTVKVVKPNNDGALGVSPTINLSSRYGIYDQANWYRFYTYRSANSGPYSLYVGWKKNGTEGSLEVTGNLFITGAVYIRLRFDNDRIHFEASLDGANWSTAYAETFSLPGYTLATPFYYELTAYKTGINGIRTVDDFSICYNASSNLARESMSTEAVFEPIPAAFALQNYPNPFNAATRIRFALPQAAEIEVKVFDMAGHALLELANGERAAGSHEVIWNGRSRNGNELSSGVYFVRLRYRSDKNGAWSQLQQRVLMVK